MSSTDIRIASNGLQCNYWHMASITLLFYDHLLTLKTEIRCLWKQPSHISGYLFFLHRYFNPITTILAFVTLFDNLPVSCKALTNIREGVLIIAQLIVTFILTLRIYALYACNKRLLCFMLIVIAVLLTIVFVVTYTTTNAQPSSPLGTCSTVLNYNDASRSAVAWLMIFVYDVLLFGLAVYNAFKTRQDLRMIHKLKTKVSLRVILLRDGAMYFGIMSLVNLANILTYYFLQDCMRGGLAPFTSSLSVTLVSRLMLNLHEAADTGIYMSQTTTRVDEPAGARIVFYEPSRRSEDSDDSDGDPDSYEHELENVSFP